MGTVMARPAERSQRAYVEVAPKVPRRAMPPAITLDAQGAAQALSLSPRTIHPMAHSGELPSFRVDKRRLFAVAAIRDPGKAVQRHGLNRSRVPDEAMKPVWRSERFKHTCTHSHQAAIDSAKAQGGIETV
jgi:hypothetical protein